MVDRTVVREGNLSYIYKLVSAKGKGSETGAACHGDGDFCMRQKTEAVEIRRVFPLDSFLSRFMIF